MSGKVFGNSKLTYFIGGVASATLGLKMLKSESGRKLCVKGLAHGMMLQKDAVETFQNMKEEAADICFDAKKQADTDK